MNDFIYYPPQNPREFEEFCHLVRVLQPKVFLEIGSRRGRSTLRLSEAAMPAIEKVICVDLPNAAWGSRNSEISLRGCLNSLEDRGISTELHLIDSHGEEAGRIAKTYRHSVDLLFIDGDHSFEGVKQDYERFGPCVRPGGLIAFHDVCGRSTMSSRGVQMGVHILWDLLNRKSDLQTELIHDSRRNSKYGIGVIRVASQKDDANQRNDPIPTGDPSPTNRDGKNGTRYCFTSPYRGSWPMTWKQRGVFPKGGEKIVRESELAKLASNRDSPDLVAMWSFIIDRFGFTSRCRELGINTIAVEDGFFPHYKRAHADPIGFSWESSLPRLVFGPDDLERFRPGAIEARKKWLARTPIQELPPEIRRPFVLWPLQLIKDSVNRWDQNFETWDAVIQHFRNCLPESFQLVIKPHPRGRLNIRRPLPSNTVMLSKNCDLGTLLHSANGVAGVNSTVLLEARLMFDLPVWVYGRGWHSGHQELFLPVHLPRPPRELPKAEWLENSGHRRSEYLQGYVDWFTGQLLARQLCFGNRDQVSATEIRKRIDRLSHSNWIGYGEEIFHHGPPKE